ncbi:YceI family protein [Arcobacter sp. FWKO B]|uniref:YceI family protein n=1 Tax=Arcobacter sp. FWKO B TaxID=2593672 RepID=UPI0018A5B893|nr:YceI family protein [Arcobacter sp. FWKO B]QOG11524.1 polyisoprenoid-binding protein [Arcobacter sp. FWKO B]
MKKLRNLLVAGFVAFGLGVSAAELVIDGGHSEVGFSIKHLMITNVKGKFTDYDGDIEFDTKGKKFTKFDATVKAASIDTGIEKRDDHLRSADFFEVDKHPDIKFVMNSYEKKTDSSGVLKGNIEIRGISKPVELNATINGIVKDMSGKTKIGFSIDGQINRKDFGLNWNRALEFGGVAVGDEVKLIIEIQAVVIED